MIWEGDLIRKFGRKEKSQIFEIKKITKSCDWATTSDSDPQTNANLQTFLNFFICITCCVCIIL